MIEFLILLHNIINVSIVSLCYEIISEAKKENSEDLSNSSHLLKVSVWRMNEIPDYKLFYTGW